MYARLAEITSLDGSIAVTLAAHQAIGLKVKIDQCYRTPHKTCTSGILTEGTCHSVIKFYSVTESQLYGGMRCFSCVIR